MRYPILFMVIASSLLAVYSLPMEARAGPYEHSCRTLPVLYATSLSRTLNKVFGRRPDDEIEFKNLYNPLPVTPEMNYIEVTGVLGCTEDNPCPGWMAKRDANGQWVVGIREPGSHQYNGRAPDAPDNATVGRKNAVRYLQRQWETYKEVFLRNFMVPEVTIARAIATPEKECKPEEYSEPLNRALNRESKDPIISKVKLGKMPDPPEGYPGSDWFYFRLVKGDKRCSVESPCFGCIVRGPGTTHEPGRIHLLIAQKGTVPGQFVRIGVYPDHNENQMLTAMQNQIQHWTKGK
ncbi:hypothetical protein BDP27DRAFT_1317465 [Rhodocollybia butyracea]|uniref:Uncharacterized protein n=1 Tax=Rhodocollybia butyracea TaxID=206335 RepID=A0A9P5Q3Z2_9AGAR|nr:hypothetical protein BDP27DRAFT_1317465 [Rhodocollybia butyracea]